MPVVKKTSAVLQTGSSVRIPDLRDSSDSMDQHSAAGPSGVHQHDNAKLELIRDQAGEITSIKVRCGCGRVTSIDCEYASAF